jgi:thioredoxin reductase
VRLAGSARNGGGPAGELLAAGLVMLDAIVVGGGPAGLSAATWLARYRRTVLVLDSGEYRNRWADASHGYFSRDPANPADLLARARADLDAYPSAELRHARVVKAASTGDGGFEVVTETERLTGRRLVLATGVRDQFPEVEGFLEHYGASVFHCPSCDGYEAKGRPVVAIGWSEQVVGFALELLGWASQVTVVTDGRRFEGDRGHRDTLERHGVAVLEETALELVGPRGDLRAIRLEGGETVECELGFFSIAHHPLTGLGEQLGCERDPDGYLVVDANGATTVPGVFAAGDVTPGLQLVQVAAGSGATAGVGCALSLENDPRTPPPLPPDVEDQIQVTSTGGASS